MKKKILFVDTGAWFALADVSDQYHTQAIDIYPKVLKDFDSLITTNLVVAETYVLIRRNIGHQAAMIFLENVAGSPRIVKIYSDNILEETAEDVLRKYHDHDFSFTDAVSFAVMKQLGIDEAFAFDRHFVAAGFVVVPELSGFRIQDA